MKGGWSGWGVWGGIPNEEANIVRTGRYLISHIPKGLVGPHLLKALARREATYALCS